MDDLAYWAKKLLTAAVYPVPITLYFLVLAFWLSGRGRAGAAGGREVPAKLLLGLGILWLLLCSTPFVPHYFLRRLEFAYPKLGTRAEIVDRYPGADAVPFIVVLGGGADNSTDPSVHQLSKLPSSSLRRVLEAVRLHEIFPQTKLIFMGGDGEAEVMSQCAGFLGVAPESRIRENLSRDTEEQARVIKPLVGGQTFFLVTSAWHMPRSAGLFRHQGLHFIPDPLDFITDDHSANWTATPLYWLLPNATSLGHAEIITKEYLGICVARFRGVFSYPEKLKP